MPKIVSLQDTGRMWKEFHILDVAFDNNDSGNVLAKSTTPSYKVGDEVQYTKNERGGIKIQRDFQPNNSSSNNSPSNYTPRKSNDSKDEQIARSVVFKGAVDLVGAGVIELKDIAKFVVDFTPVVLGEAQPQTNTYAQHFEDSSPF